MPTFPPAADRHAARGSRHAGPDPRARCVRAQPETPERIARSGAQDCRAPAREEPQVPADRAAPDRARRGRRVLPESERSRSDGRRRRAATFSSRTRSSATFKAKRLAALANQARVAVCADDADNVRSLDAAAGEFGVTLDVLVEINVGANRCGVEPGEPAVKLAQAIRDMRASALRGIAGLPRRGAAPAQSGRPPRRDRAAAARA